MRGQKERAENQYIPEILLNNLRVNGDKISVELKQDLYENLFKRYRKVTVKRLRNYLIQEGIVEKGVDLSGIDGDFKASLKSYHDLKKSSLVYRFQKQNRSS